MSPAATQPEGRNATIARWLLLAILTAGCTALSAADELRRYREFRTGWSWDLAYYNQWCWAFTQGDGQLSVRPAASYADEGPSVWKMNYLAPVRFALLPLYSLWPDPRTLLLINSVVLWWVIPAAYTLAKSESGSIAVAVSAALLVPLTPLLWPLAVNDFRELQVAVPFVLWAVQGVRSRNVRLSALSILALLACRQELALIVATLAFLPAREPEPLNRALNWRQALLVTGLGWILFAFFGYLHFGVSRGAPDRFIDQFLGPRAGVGETLATSFDLLAAGTGAWALLALFAPRAAILAIPWVWTLCNGRWALRYLAAEQWHHVRYTVPPLVMVLAAGLIGYALLGRWLLARRWGGIVLALTWLLAAAGNALGLQELLARMEGIPRPILAQEAEALWYWIGQVAPDDGVLATYEVTAPLSSRKRLYSYILDQNRPKGFPRLDPAFQWAFVRNSDFPLTLFTDQGFQLVHRGPFLSILRRMQAPT